MKTSSEGHYCVILQLIITFLHLDTSVTDFISNFRLYSSMLVICVIVLVILLTSLIQLVVFAVVLKVNKMIRSITQNP